MSIKYNNVHLYTEMTPTKVADLNRNKLPPVVDRPMNTSNDVFNEVKSVADIGAIFRCKVEYGDDTDVEKKLFLVSSCVRDVLNFCGKRDYDALLRTCFAVNDIKRLLSYDYLVVPMLIYRESNNSPSHPSESSCSYKVCSVVVSIVDGGFNLLCNTVERRTESSKHNRSSSDCDCECSIFIKPSSRMTSSADLPFFGPNLLKQLKTIFIGLKTLLCLAFRSVVNIYNIYMYLIFVIIQIYIIYIYAFHVYIY